MFRRLFGRGQDAPRTEEEAQQEEQKIDHATEKARQGFFGQISSLFAVDDPITDELWDDLESLLIQADVGVETTQYLVNRTKDRCNRNGVKRVREAKEMLKAEMVRTLQEQAGVDVNLLLFLLWHAVHKRALSTAEIAELEARIAPAGVAIAANRFSMIGFSMPRAMNTRRVR